MELIVAAATVYGGIGAVVALGFVAVGVGRIDAAARGAWAVRVLWLPGLVLLWPIVVIRWGQLERQAR